MPNGYVAQGDTNNAADCRVAFNRLKTKLGTSNVYKYGFSTLNDTPLVPHADQSIFIAAKNYNILYWSSHGSSTPALNVTNGPMFGSYSLHIAIGEARVMRLMFRFLPHAINSMAIRTDRIGPII